MVACAGLFGLSLFMIEQRAKEIGIRKVLGASFVQILNLQSREFCFIALISALLVSPVAFYVMRQWLQNFAYRIDLTIWPFLLAGSAALVISLLTISWQAIRAATANPVEALRYE
jgi:putative ABC transport system permease protein